MRIGVFGGSFDPIHRGHLAVAAAAADRLSLDRVLFVPVREQPLKRVGPVASAEDRVAMLRAAIAGDPRFVVDEQELRRPGPSYTVDTLRALHTAHPGDALFLLIGADAARAFPRWRDPEEIAGLATVVVLTRPGVRTPEHPLLAERLDVPALDIAARDIRARCRRGDPIENLVPDAVARLIAERRLYTTED
ncbi:MAG TPA: nicotinate-nucleotide adenylyltransferase [Gemmatimonadales bacterium]|nr:nicotinate-nucleotide adenylyltransferase [Gemmatimonadales bacterium]